MATEKDFQEEIEKCKDPVYFYENYWLVNGEKPTPLAEYEKEILRARASNRPISHIHGRNGDKILIISHSDTTTALALSKVERDIEIVHVETGLNFTRFDEPECRERFPTMPITIHEPPRLTCFIPTPPSKREKAKNKRRGATHYNQ